VNDRVAQPAVRQRHRRLCHTSLIRRPPQGRSRGRVVTRCFVEVDTTRQPGHRAASGLALTRCITGQPSLSTSTRVTPNPSNPSRSVVSWLKLVTFV
jgi:hypothetical protein